MGAGAKGSAMGGRMTETELPEGLRRWNERVDRWFSVAATIVIDVMAFFSLVAMVWASVGVGIGLYEVILGRKYDLLSGVIVEILTVFIVVEVLSVSVRFLRANRIDVRDLVDVTLAIIFREIWVGMFSKEIHWQELIALAFLVSALGGMRLFMTRQRALKISDPEDG